MTGRITNKLTQARFRIAKENLRFASMPPYKILAFFQKRSTQIVSSVVGGIAFLGFMFKFVLDIDNTANLVKA